MLEIRLGGCVWRGCARLFIVDEGAGGRVIVRRRDGHARRRIGGGSIERRSHLQAIVAEGASLGGLTELVFGAAACVKACAISSELTTIRREQQGAGSSSGMGKGSIGDGAGQHAGCSHGSRNAYKASTHQAHPWSLVSSGELRMTGVFGDREVDKARRRTVKLLRVPVLLSGRSSDGLWDSSWRREGKAQLAPELARDAAHFSRGSLNCLAERSKDSQSPLRQAGQRMTWHAEALISSSCCSD